MDVEVARTVSDNVCAVARKCWCFNKVVGSADQGMGMLNSYVVLEQLPHV